MQLTEHTPGDHYFIRSVTPQSVQINDDIHHASVILGARLLIGDWSVRSLGDLSEQTVAPLIEHSPEVVVLGAGTQQAFPSTDILRLFLSEHIGVECMTLDAACRTFNVLMSENRRALLGLILPGSNQ